MNTLQHLDSAGFENALIDLRQCEFAECPLTQYSFVLLSIIDDNHFAAFTVSHISSLSSGNLYWD